MTSVNTTAPRSRRQVAAHTGVNIGVLRSLEADGLLPAGALTAADEIVVRALTWADGARGGDREHERLLAARVRQVLDSPSPETSLLVLVAGDVLAARDDLEALLLVRGRRGPVTLLPLGTWIAEVLAA